MDINNFTFTYKQLSAPDARRHINDWEAIILNKETNVSFGIRFNCQGDPSLHSQEVFNNFLNKKVFKEQFFIECHSELVIDNVTEKTIDQTPKIIETT